MRIWEKEQENEPKKDIDDFIYGTTETVHSDR